MVWGEESEGAEKAEGGGPFVGDGGGEVGEVFWGDGLESAEEL